MSTPIAALAMRMARESRGLSRSDSATIGFTFARSKVGFERGSSSTSNSGSGAALAAVGVGAAARGAGVVAASAAVRREGCHAESDAARPHAAATRVWSRSGRARRERLPLRANAVHSGELHKV